MALDQIEVMRHFGFERFALCGHDRGGRVGYRMALDHPGVVTKLAVLDIVPTWEAFSRADLAFGLSYWHWFYLAQPFDLPKRLLTADPENTLFRGGSETISPEAMEQYVRCLRGLPRRRHRRHRPRRRRPRGRQAHSVPCARPLGPQGIP
jgi:haloacetate dehalogenase